MAGTKPLDFQTFQTDNEVKNIIFLLHGYGSNGKDLITLAPELAKGCKNLLFVSPNALEPLEGSAPGFFQWFSLLDRSYNTIKEHTETAALEVTQFIEQISENYGVPLSNIFMLGFSQGAMMCLHIAYRLPVQIMGVIGLGGRLNMPGLFAQEVLNRPPALLIHGAEDDIVPPYEMEDAAKTLAENVVEVETHLRPKLAHGIDEESVIIVNKFLRKYV